MTDRNTWHMRYDPQTAHLFDHHEQPQPRWGLIGFAVKTLIAITVFAAVTVALFALNSLTR